MTDTSLKSRRNLIISGGTAALMGATTPLTALAAPALCGNGPIDDNALLHAYWALIHWDERLLRENEINRVGVQNFRVPVDGASIEACRVGDINQRARSALTVAGLPFQLPE